MKKFVMAALGGTVAGVLMTTQVAGPLLAQEASKTSSVYEQLDLFGDIFERIRSQYAEPVDEGKLIEAAINGMLTSLDPHSSYLPPDDFKDMRVQTSGEFGGLGIEVTQEEGFIKVVSPIDGTPAFNAGILAGDFITHVDGESVLGLTLDQAVELMRGPVGSEIIVTVARKGTDEPFDVSIIRDTIKLTAAKARLEGNTVVLRVMDDGRGIDRRRVLEAARAAGHLPAAASVLSDDDLLRVLARPGFSTAAEVTDVSGRGMGMDAALTRVRTLGGSVELTTAPGEGSTFTLRLPTTLAIVRALLAQVGEERYAIPIAGVAETVEYRPERAAPLGGEEGFVLRDEILPLVQLRDRLGVPGPRLPGRPPVVILEVGERRAALLVEALVGQQEIVVEPFDAPRGMLPVFSGATILGDGVPALIVDPAALV